MRRERSSVPSRLLAGDYDPTCKAPKPPPAGHLSLSKVECQTCHGATGTATQFYFAGVVWHWGGKQGAANIEVGLRDGNTFIYTCTDANGFFSVPLATTPPINWLSVESRIRAELGEKIMPSDKEHKPTCNDSKCHADPCTRSGPLNPSPRAARPDRITHQNGARTPCKT